MQKGYSESEEKDAECTDMKESHKNHRWKHLFYGVE